MHFDTIGKMEKIIMLNLYWKKVTSASAALLLLMASSQQAVAQTINPAQLDLNDDLVVNTRDMLVLRQCLNSQASCNPDADFNDDGFINIQDYKILRQHYGEVVPAASVGINGEQAVTVPLGESVLVLYSVNLDAQAPGAYDLGYSDSVTPSDGGLGVSNDAGSTFPTTLGDSGTRLINETLTGNEIGVYTLTKTVTLTDPPGTAEFQVVVNVVDAVEVPVLNQPGAEPPGIPVNVQTPVIFNVTLSGTSNIPDSVEIRKVGPGGEDLGLMATLSDDGTGVDGVAGDFSFTGANSVLGAMEGAINYRAIVSFPGGDTAASSVSHLVVTDVPIGLGSNPIAETEIDPSTNSEVVTGQVLVTLAPGTTPEAAAAAVSSLGFEVLGYEPALGVMLVGFQSNATTLAEALGALGAMPEFAEVEPNGIDQIAEYTPNDPSYGSQWGFTKTRADEAWVIARGQGVIVAMLDTGADLDHPDLQANLWKLNVTIPMPWPILPIVINSLGFDMVDGDMIPEDADGHGTHVAGTIAAVSNNGTQVAGMAPNAKVMVIRTLGPGGGSHAQFANGVRKAADMGAKIISYSGGGSHSATKQNAVNYAVGKGVLFIAAAGNDSTTSKTSAYPAAYTNVMAIGSTTSTDGRSGFSNRGSWVAMAAPGSSIMSTWLAGGINTIGGTSMATPHVSGAAALVWGHLSSPTATKVRDRLLKNAKPLPAALQLGAGRLDVFASLFNSTFEMGNLSGWVKSGAASSVAALGPLAPPDRARMAYISTGPAATNISTSMSQDFTVQAGISSIPVQLEYNFVTEEYPEWVGTQYNDCVQIKLQTPDGSIHTLAYESVNSSDFSPVGGVSLPGGDDTVGQTGWKTVAVNVPVTQGAGKYRIFITDKGDDIFDSVLLMDDIRFKASVATTTPLLGLVCN